MMWFSEAYLRDHVHSKNTRRLEIDYAITQWKNAQQCNNLLFIEEFNDDIIYFSCAFHIVVN